jgi:hypothetical protein
MGRKLRGPEDYAREELLVMAERVGLKYRSRMSKQELYDKLGLGQGAAKKGSARSRSGTASAAGSAADPRPAERRHGAPAPLGLEGTPIGRALATTLSSPAPRPQPTGPYVDRGPELPAGYGDDRIVALVRDPRALFAYWEVAGGAYERARAERGEAALAGAVWVLRVTRVNDGQFFDIPVSPGAGNWYLHVEPASRYQVKIGLVLASGQFVELAASDVISTPPEDISERIDEEWMLVSEEFERLMLGLVRDRNRPGSLQGGERQRQRLALRRRQLVFPWNISSRISSPMGASRISSGAWSRRK